MAILIVLLGLLMFVVPIAIVVLIIQAIAKKSKDKKGINDIMRNIYIYLILIITLVVIISGAISAFSIGLDVLLPEKQVNDSSYNSQEREHNENIVEFLTFNYISSIIFCSFLNIHHVPMGSGKSLNSMLSFVIGCSIVNLYAHKAICFPFPLVPYFWSPNILCPK